MSQDQSDALMEEPKGIAKSVDLAMIIKMKAPKSKVLETILTDPAPRTVTAIGEKGIRSKNDPVHQNDQEGRTEKMIEVETGGRAEMESEVPPGPSLPAETCEMRERRNLFLIEKRGGQATMIEIRIAATELLLEQFLTNLANILAPPQSSDTTTMKLPIEIRGQVGPRKTFAKLSKKLSIKVIQPILLMENEGEGHNI